MLAKLPMRWLFLFFAFLSLSDLVLTSILIRWSEGDVYESNPLANWCLASFGMTGLVGYKVLMVTVVLSLVVVISQTRPRAGKGVLVFSCSAMSLVVLYSGFLLGYLGLQGYDNQEQDEAVQRLVERLNQSMDYDLLQEQL